MAEITAVKSQRNALRLPMCSIISGPLCFPKSEWMYSMVIPSSVQKCFLCVNMLATNAGSYFVFFLLGPCNAASTRMCVREHCAAADYLWGIPMITLSTPLLLDRSMMVLRAGMSDSQPSRPNRFSDDHFLWRNSSNLRDVQSPLLFFLLFFTRRTAAARWVTLQTWWTGSFGPAGSSSPRGWTAWCPASRTSAWSTCTAARRWWTWTPRQCADSRRPEGEGEKRDSP